MLYMKVLALSTVVAFRISPVQHCRALATRRLSVVAITYYTTGVLGYPLKALDKLHMLPVPLEVALGMSVPLIAVGVYGFLHQMKKHVHGG